MAHLVLQEEPASVHEKLEAQRQSCACKDYHPMAASHVRLKSVLEPILLRRTKASFRAWMSSGQRLVSARPCVERPRSSGNL